jgi:transcriptional regulator with XRE-family HTH domain
MPNDPLAEEIAAKFKTALEARRISKARAARDLQVSRQMLYEYLRGRSVPKQAVLQRACAAWGLELKYRNLIVNARSFPPLGAAADANAPVQLDLDLQAAIEQLSNENLGVKILKKDNGRVDLQVSLRFGTAG